MPTRPPPIKSPRPRKTPLVSPSTSASDIESTYRGDNDEEDETSWRSGRRKNMKRRAQRQVFIKELTKNLTKLTQHSYQLYPQSYAISMNVSLI